MSRDELPDKRMVYREKEMMGHNAARARTMIRRKRKKGGVGDNGQRLERQSYPRVHKGSLARGLSLVIPMTVAV